MQIAGSNTPQIVEATNETIENSPKKAYNTPKLQRYGSLAELVQTSPGRATDGGAGDCTAS